MIEILVLFSLCRKIGNLVRGKGRRPWGYQLLCVLAWFGAEFLTLFGYAIATGEEPRPAVYLMALVAAGLAGGAVYVIARNVPSRLPGEGPECPECGEPIPRRITDCPVCGARLDSLAYRATPVERTPADTADDRGDLFGEETRYDAQGSAERRGE